MAVIMDGVTYRVRVKIGTLEQSFRIDDGDNAGIALSGDDIRDIIGTYYDYAMEVEPDPEAWDDYDRFFWAISAPVNSHTITVPDRQGTMTYKAKVTSGRHRKKDRVGGVTRWTGLQVEFRATQPYRVPEEEP